MNGTTNKIVEAFGKFMAQINGEIATFDTLAAAEEAVAVSDNATEFVARAEAYCLYRAYDGKNKVGKSRVVMDFMAFEAAGCPVREVVEPETVDASDSTEDTNAPYVPINKR